MPFVSPFSSVLQTNFEPSPIEIDGIKQTLEGHISELSTLDEEIKYLQKELDSTTEELDGLLVTIDEHRKLLTPFRALPDDVIGEIFIWCLPTSHEAIVSRNEPPLVLGYVCKRWRTIAYRMPRLWATLHISIPKVPKFRGRVDAQKKNDMSIGFQQNVNDHLNGIWKWLKRSKAIPLSISIHDANSSNLSWDYQLPTTVYFEMVLRLSKRIYRLELDVKQEITSDYLASFPSSAFPILRILFLKFNHNLNFYHSLPDWGTNGLLNTPNLTCLKLLSFSQRLSEVSANWSNLTFIVAKGFYRRELDILDALHIFTNCPRLYYCDVKIAHDAPALPEYISFSHQHLHTLSITSSTMQIVDLFQYADIPALRDIRYHTKVTPSHRRRSPLLAILSRTNYMVESLTINIQYFTLSDLLECFTMVPSLTHFCHTHLKSDTDFSRESGYPTPLVRRMMSALLSMLTPKTNYFLYLPKLRVAKFNLTPHSWRTESYMVVSDDDVLNFIRGRMDSAASSTQLGGPIPVALHHVSFQSLYAKEIDLQAELSRYIDDGLKLNISYICKVDNPYIKMFEFDSPRLRPRVIEIDYL